MRSVAMPWLNLPDSNHQYYFTYLCLGFQLLIKGLLPLLISLLSVVKLCYWYLKSLLERVSYTFSRRFVARHFSENKIIAPIKDSLTSMD